MSDLNLIFETLDPRGKRVICPEDRWRLHVLAARPWLRSEDVKQAIEHPTFGIFADAAHPGREIYYLRQFQAGSTRYLKVVVQFVNDEGEVITAFPASAMKKGERLIWPT